ncbi:hypothetical protein ROA7023_00931 [Roseisalinus antarcticus]|uniref:Cytochrome b561 bacterial/Ni-hydrogenase domain-containing protein n=2 Tax=Roseisalinus antarcticus TaxID=254357 RepID=A0A1Y5RYC0_9RHOB|nr:hypothetical protein ROA7023_00931 [Roseisalinus antarcticus]
MHWTIVPFFIWFLLVQPDDVRHVGQWAVRLHSVFGLVFVTLSLLWTADFLRRGLAGRPGPKLCGWQRRFHGLLHRTLVLGLFGVALTGFLLGLTSTVLLWAGGIVPIAPPLALPRASEIVGLVHYVEFYGLALVALIHAGFHLWRHLRLRDNALRIMAPRFLHRFL